ncbi:MAG TPA: protocatechuate 3,4-dioxygenase subunit alpha [Terriglobales bacterium]|nr:protocatechuate 3,4-dioxygenase subunit alpha [Terriglobales bacterium]
MKLVPTASQTVGPYFYLGLTGPRSTGCLAGPNAQGEPITITFRVLDGEGQPVPDAMLEIWQANAAGKYNHPEDTQAKPLDPGCEGYGRMGTDAAGGCEFQTIKPGRVEGPKDRLQAPHLNLSVFARGLLKRLATRVYFSGEAANDEDFALSLVPAERRATLLANPEPSQPGRWRFDIHLQGEQETVFFDV